MLAMDQEDELAEVELRLRDVNASIARLKREQASLQDRKDEILTSIREQEQNRQVSLEPDWRSGSGFPWSDILVKIARDTFGFNYLRAGQLEVMNASLSGYDVFSIMKTGGGKSLCYQLPALFAPEGFSLVVCPLLALIRDQVRLINEIQAGSALSLAGTMERAEQNTVYKAMDTSRMRLLYVTPEKVIKSKLLMTHLQRAYDRGHLNSIVIDEAHCASQWGHDFRPDYAKLHVLRTVFPSVPLLLLTATANQTVRHDITEMLGLGSAVRGERNNQALPNALGISEIKGFKTFVGDFDRPNLVFEVRRKPRDFAGCVDMVRAALPEPETGNAIVYCFSQKECTQVAEALLERGVSAAPYHAGLSDYYRESYQDDWVGGRVQVICATIAFGLGINMPSVRLVMHFTLSKSLELYYQEAGRAGRDGDPARCILLYAPDDVLRIASMAVHEVDKDPGGGGRTRPKVLSMIKYCQAKICRRQLFAQTLDTATESDYGVPDFSIRCCAIEDENSLGGEIPKELCDNCRRSSLLVPCSTDAVEEVRRVVDAVKQCVEKSQSTTGASETTGLLTLKKVSGSSLVKAVVKKCVTVSSSDDIDYIVAGLLEQGVLRLHYHYTPYSTLCYIVAGHNFYEDIYTSAYITTFFLMAPNSIPDYESTVNIYRGAEVKRLKRRFESPVNGSKKRKVGVAVSMSTATDVVDLT